MIRWIRSLFVTRYTITTDESEQLVIVAKASARQS